MVMPHKTTLTAAVLVAVGAFAAIAALALVSIAGASSAHHGRSDAQLLHAYQPVLVFHPDEKFRPTKIQSFVRDSELEKFTGSSPQQLPLDAFWTVVDPDPDADELPPPTPGVFYRLDQAVVRPTGPLRAATATRLRIGTDELPRSTAERSAPARGSSSSTGSSTTTIR